MTVARTSHSAGFDEWQRHTLRRVLTDKYDTLRPVLETAIRSDPQAPGIWEDKAAIRKQAAVAKRLERVLQRCLEKLTDAAPSIMAAHARRYLPTYTPLGDFLEDPAHTGGTLQSSWPWASWVSALDALLQNVTTWQQHAHADSRLIRGRKVGDRILLAEWVGLKLDEAGIRLTVSAQGRWARTLSVVYDAARVEPIPEDLFRDVQQAYNFLHETFPERFPQRTKLRHKTKKK